MPFTVEELRTVAMDPRLSREQRMEALNLLNKQLSSQPASGWERMTPREKTARVGSTVGRMVELGGGLLPNPFVRLPAVALGGGLAQLSEGKSLSETAKHVGTQLSLEAILPGLKQAKWLAKRLPSIASVSEAAPRIGAEMSLRLGGLKGNTPKAAGAFVRERQRAGFGGGILPGSRKKALLQQKAVGKELKGVEESSPLWTDLGDVVKDVPASIETVGKTFRKAAQREITRNQEAFLAGHPARVTMRQLGSVRRGQQREAARFFKAAGEGPISPQDPLDIASRMAAGRGAALKTTQDIMLPEVVPINERLADLHTILGTASKLRGGGRILGDLGQMGIRAGYGSGLGLGISALSGFSLDPRTAVAAGGLGGPVLLSPRVLMGAGFAGGRAATAAPTLMRGLELMRLQMERDRMEKEQLERERGGR